MSPHMRPSSRGSFIAMVNPFVGADGALVDMHLRTGQVSCVTISIANAIGEGLSCADHLPSE